MTPTGSILGSNFTGNTTGHQRKWNQYVPYLEKQYMDELRMSSMSPLSYNRRQRKITKRKMQKKIERLAVPNEKPMVERDVPANETEHHELFANFLRDPSPISPERAKVLRRGASRNSGAVSARLSTNQSTLRSGKKPHLNSTLASV